MSSISDIDLDLEKLFQPAWAQEKPATNRFDRFTGNEGVKPERRFNDKPGERRAPRREAFGGGDRPRSGGKFGGKKDFRRDDRSERRERPEPPPPLPEISVTFVPGENGVESLARQIKMTGRCYPLFQIAQLVLEKPERYSVQLAVKKKSDGTIAQQLFVCALDDTPWLSEDEAVAHVLKNHFATFYQAERTATEPPKGTYTFVAQCGLSGAILGPPNYHDYQNQLRKLHAERFSRMPFDVFKSRVKIVKDEAVVKKWIEEQSSKTEYTVLNVPEPLKLATLEEVEKHFRATHKETIIKSVETLVLAGVPSRTLRSRGLQQLIRAEWEQQKYFPLTVATRLSQQFASHGLQFFKVNKTVTHVAVARPQFLDLATTPVSESIKRIVEFINAHPKCTRRKMIETLAPSPAKPTVIEIKPEEQKSTALDEPTAEQTAIIADLHWLVHQGHVLEFADGKLDTAKKPLPKPPKPEKKKEKPASEVPATIETAPQAEAVAENSILTEAEISASESETIPSAEVPSPS
ncbi:MAG TPA: hypothetical protein VHX90_00705 [Verrucomicrobiae bacterium]|nr:hypothetical protein [Verrucomicrobiae bacterium]